MPEFSSTQESSAEVPEFANAAAGRPMAVLLPEVDGQTKHLERGIPAKKRPLFLNRSTPTLDPRIPVKKQVSPILFSQPGVLFCLQPR
jgi:hypothetical protein